MWSIFGEIFLWHATLIPQLLSKGSSSASEYWLVEDICLKYDYFLILPSKYFINNSEYHKNVSALQAFAEKNVKIWQLPVKLGVFIWAIIVRELVPGGS